MSLSRNLESLKYAKLIRGEINHFQLGEKLATFGGGAKLATFVLGPKLTTTESTPQSPAVQAVF